MKNVWKVMALLLVSAIPSFAQTPKIQIEFGPTFDRYTPPNGYYLNMPGWTGSGEYNVFRWLGGEFQASGAYSNKAVIGRTSLYTVQVGPVFYPLRHHKLTPWGHFLIGEGYYRDAIPENGGFPAKVESDYHKAWRVGAGVDLSLKNRRWGVRMFQFDYGPTKFFNTKVSQPDYRLSIGVTYRIGSIGGNGKKKK